MADKHPHILVVSDPPVAPGYLPRVRYICDYLVRQGYAVTLLTEESGPMPFLRTYPVKTIRMYSGGMCDWALKTAWTLMTDWHNRVFARRALADMDSGYDLVLCTAFSDFPLGAAQRIARTLHLPLVCDIRDLDEQVRNSRYQYRHQYWWTMPFRLLYRAIHIRRRNRVIRSADAVTTVSPWHAGFIRSTLNERVHIIYNGFDGQQFYPQDIPAERFTVSYIGSLFDWQRAALEKVKRAVEQVNKQLGENSIILDLHTPDSHPVPHDRLGDAIRSSSVMLVLTSTDTHGMLTTKFYEALGCAKPVLCVPSDKGDLAELIAETNAGIATDDKQVIQSFLMERYDEWRKKGFTHQPVTGRDAYSRETQCERLKTILTNYIYHES